ncbi:molybdenum transport ATP-binding protein ModC [Aquipluma nitroreducens]|uniref:Molybdenum transport ATP-binding protein ModC n=1 Tax=Aquipluma nitroreducens TaxID=2010828 RepID=A0A5K7S5N9_9BACT|nr:ATP-binding cassette domain-containing protein [Aquipluma nitroreducens]BBE16868.1 molybdenum transport ATP-binding protein ModC [Aquipluma nitroreducens]
MENSVIFIDIEKRMLTANGPMNLSIHTTIPAGELVALFGESGAGKTTLLRILAGLVTPDKGLIKFGSTVWFDSEKKINIPPQLRNISLMFQDYALFPNMTVEQNIQFAQPEKDQSKVNELLALFGLTEFRKRKPTGLSGGQKQRVALARALVRKPQLLLLDEPLSALDAEMRIALQDEIAQAHQLLGVTTIMVSHDLNEVFRLATQVLCIENGSITRTGNPEEVFSDSSISGKVQITGQIARIEKQDTINVVTVISGNNQIIKVIAFESDLENLKIGDRVMVFSKAFNPIISKLR